MRRYLAVVALGLSLLAPAARVDADTRVYVRVGPPAAIVETRPVAPGPRHIWIAGYHRWDGQNYVWVPGHWDLPPAHYRTWVPGHWVHHQHNGWYWVEGHWRR
jgi:hypothetical protein